MGHERRKRRRIDEQSTHRPVEWFDLQLFSCLRLWCGRLMNGTTIAL
jgi:hypothetical protein